MMRELHGQAKAVFQEAIELAPELRLNFVAQACRDNDPLRQEVESLLRHHDSQTIIPVDAEGGSPGTAAHRGGTQVQSPGPRSVIGNMFRARTLRSGPMGWFAMNTPRRQLIAVTTACILLVGSGGLVYQLMQRALGRELESELTALLEADIEAMRMWFRSQEATALVTALDPAVVQGCQRIVQLVEGKEDLPPILLASEEMRQLRLELAPLLETYDFRGFIVLDRLGRIVAANDDILLGNTGFIGPVGELTDVFGESARTTIVPPFPSRTPQRDVDNQLRVGVPTMFVVAPVKDSAKSVIGALCLRISPERDFTRILNVARSGQTGETYAFDRNGRLLSESRFDTQLTDLGLLVDQPYARSILNVEVRDPGVDLTAGARPALRRPNQPFTQAAAEAIAGRSGVNVAGYRDYRGVKVVGAWTWLPDLGFGVTTQMDAREAFAPMYYLESALAGLLLFLGVAVATTLLASVAIVRMRREVDETRQVGPYQLELLLGEGGMAQVFLARHNLLKRPTAVKLLKPDRATTRDMARFEREVQLASQLTHPNTIEIFDFGQATEGRFYCAMEYVPGLTLAQLILRDGAVPVARTVAILRQIGGSLREAHCRGLIHRDIKPQNIMICERGGICDFVKVLDFGLAKPLTESAVSPLTQGIGMIGTPLYIAPEIFRGPCPPDPRSDLYSLGVVAFNLLTGKDPFRGENLVELFDRVLHDEAPQLTEFTSNPIPAALQQLVMACLAKRPESRPASVDQFLEVLDREDLGPVWTQTDARAWWAELLDERSSATLPG